MPRKVSNEPLSPPGTARGPPGRYKHRESSALLPRNSEGRLRPVRYTQISPKINCDENFVSTHGFELPLCADQPRRAHEPIEVRVDLLLKHMDPIEIGAILPFAPTECGRLRDRGLQRACTLVQAMARNRSSRLTHRRIKSKSATRFSPYGHSQSPMGRLPQPPCTLTYCSRRAHSLDCGRGFGGLEAERVSFKIAAMKTAAFSFGHSSDRLLEIAEYMASCVCGRGSPVQYLPTRRKFARLCRRPERSFTARRNAERSWG